METEQDRGYPELGGGGQVTVKWVNVCHYRMMKFKNSGDGCTTLNALNATKLYI